MKHLLLTTIAAVLVVGCGESQQSTPAPEAKPAEPVAEAAKPEPPTTKAPDISIHKAVYNGNIEAIKQYLNAGRDVNAVNNWRETPLHYAARFNRRPIVDLLIAEGADVNAKDVAGGTPLGWAIQNGRTEAADLLRKHGGKTREELRAAGK